MEEMILKPLTVDNLFDLCRVLDALGVRRLMEAWEGQQATLSGREPRQVGLSLAMEVGTALLQGLPTARKEIYDFFSGCLLWQNGTRVTPEQLGSMGAAGFVRLLRAFFAREEVGDFFREVAVSLGMELTDSSV